MKKAELNRTIAFQHSQLGAYIVGIWCSICFLCHSYQSIIDKYEVVKRWWWFYGVLGLFAYLYVRPYIRIGLGSASKVYINFTTCYIAWLVGAVFYHLPSLEAMGLNIRADVSMFIVVFLSTFAALTLLWALHYAAVRLRLVQPKISSTPPGTQAQHILNMLLLNSANLALACSSYHSVCGNGLVSDAEHQAHGNLTSPSSATPGTWQYRNGGNAADRLKAAVCAKWLHPMTMQQYPSFSSWMLYGETSNSSSTAGNITHAGTHTAAAAAAWANATGEAVLGSFQNQSGAWFGIDFPLDGQGAIPVPADGILSPVLTMWITLMLLYIANSVADHAAASSLHAAHMGELRQDPGPGTPTTTAAQIGALFASVSRRSFSHIRKLDRAGTSCAGTPLASSNTRKPPRQRSALDVRKAISKSTSSPSISATAAAWGRRVIRNPTMASIVRSNTMQTLVEDTKWLQSKAAGLWDKVHDTLPSLGIASGSMGASSLFQPSLTSWMQHVMHHSKVDDSPGRISVSGGGGGNATLSRTSSLSQMAPGSIIPMRVHRSSQSGVAGNTSDLQSDLISDHGDDVEPLEDAGPKPDFLPMVPWYSGTSADLLKTCLDLLVSVKVFLGRFDMRTMQSATAASMADAFNEVPTEGDGFTYEHCEGKDELWLDFIADTGDGGDSTYTVAKALAAHQLSVHIPKSSTSELAKQVAADVAQNGGQGQKPDPHSKQPMQTMQAKGKVVGGKQLTNDKMRKAASVTATGANGVTDSGSLGSHTDVPRDEQVEGGRLVLPRGQLLLLGGDLAYPNPTKDTYEQRLLRPFQDALPPPPHYHPERLVVHKPDLPPMYGVQEAALPGGLRGLSPRASRHASSSALRSYPGPTCFAIPGNHDWIDGLETYINYIQNKGWLGGWLLPQEKSYFALKLPKGWWLFGLDLGLSDDIDMCQLRYFSNVVEQRLGPEDNVIIMTHQPVWLLEWFWQHVSSPHLRQLVRGHLRGRARLHLAGDLHFYMRHSFTLPQPAPATEQQGGEAAAAAAVQVDPKGVKKQGTATALPQGRKQGISNAVHSSVNGQAHAAAAPEALPVKQQRVNASGGRKEFLLGDTSAASASMLNDELTHNTNNGNGHSADQLSPGSKGHTGGPRMNGLASVSVTSSPGRPVLARQSHEYALTDASSVTASSCYSEAGLVPGMPSVHTAMTAPDSSAKKSAQDYICTQPHLHMQHQQQQALRADHPALSVDRDLGAALMAPKPPSSCAPGGRSDDESESGFSTASARSSRRQTKASQRPVGLKAFGRNLPAVCIPDLNLPTAITTATSTGAVPTAPVFSRSSSGREHSYQRSTHSDLSAAYIASQQPPPLTVGAIQDPSMYHMGAGLTPVRVLDAQSGTYVAHGLDCQSGPCEACLARAREIHHHTFDPEHMICNGAGGAFLHPTHVFAPAAFYPAPDPAAETTAAIYSAAQLPCTCRIYSHDSHEAWGGGSLGFNAQWSGLHTGNAADAAVPTPVDTSGCTTTQHAQRGQGCYTCQVAYPTPEKSLRVGRKNLHLFRLKNTRFDVIGGVLYYLLVVSVIPRCSRLGPVGQAILTAVEPNSTAHTADVHLHNSFNGSSLGRTAAACTAGSHGFARGGVSAILDADNGQHLLLAIGAAYTDTIYAILMDSYVSFGVLILLLGICFGLARGGGVGAVKEDGSGQKTSKAGHLFVNKNMPLPKLNLRFGGAGVQLLWGGGHALAHLMCAVTLVLVLELGVEMCIRHEQLGQQGLHSLYRWYQAFEVEHFPDPQGLRLLLQKATLGLYPGLIKIAMAIFDIPELIAVTRISVCAAGGSWAAISRLQVIGYYSGMLAYYWLLATPVVGAVFGLYLYTSVVWAGVHYDEAFSSLRIANFKSITRLHITPEGDLKIYSLGVDKVPSKWKQDPRWSSDRGGGTPSLPSHLAWFPSRWIPAWVRPKRSLSATQTHGNAKPRGSSANGSTAGVTATSGAQGQHNGSWGQPQPDVSLAGAGVDDGDGIEWKLIDYLCIPKKKHI